MRQQLQQEMYALVEQYQKSGLSQSRFCKLHGIKLHKLQYWRNKYSKHPTKLSGFAQLEVSPPVADISQIVIKLPNGTIIEIPV